MENRAGALGRAREVGAGVQRSWPVRIVLKFIGDRGPNLAVLIAWNFLQTIIPILLILLAVGGFILQVLGKGQSEIQHFIFSYFPNTNGTGSALVGAVTGAQKHSGIFALLALASFLWSASSLFGCLEQVMADCYGIKTRNFVLQKLVAVGLMLLFCVLMVIAIGGNSMVALLRRLQLPFVPNWVTQGATGPLLSTLVTIVSGVVLFFVIFWLVPRQNPQPRHALPGAIFSGILLYVLSLVFPLYLSLNKGINQYGSEFAFLFTLLFFFYFLGLITVLGIEINATLFPMGPEERSHARQPSTGPPVSRRIPRPLFAVLGAALALGLAVVTGRRLAG